MVLSVIASRLVFIRVLCSREFVDQAEVQLHENLSWYYHLNFINLAKEVTDRIAAGEFSWDKGFVNLHPSPFGMNV